MNNIFLIFYKQPTARRRHSNSYPVIHLISPTHFQTVIASKLHLNQLQRMDMFHPLLHASSSTGWVCNGMWNNIASTCRVRWRGWSVYSVRIHTESKFGHGKITDRYTIRVHMPSDAFWPLRLLPPCAICHPRQLSHLPTTRYLISNSSHLYFFETDLNAKFIICCGWKMKRFLLPSVFSKMLLLIQMFAALRHVF